MLRMFRLAAHNHKLLIALMSLIFLGVVMEISAPVIFKYIIDAWTDVYAGKPVKENFVLKYAFDLNPAWKNLSNIDKNILNTQLLLGVYFFVLFLMFLSSFSWPLFGHWWVREDGCLRFDVANKLRQLHLAYFEQDNAGKIHSRLGKGVSNIVRGVGESYAHALPRLPQLIVVLWILVHFAGWKLTLISLLPVPLMFLFAWLGYRSVTPYLEIEREHDETYDKLSYQLISGMRQVKSFGMENYFINKMADAKQKLIDNSYHLEIAYTKFSRLRDLTLKVAHGTIIYYCDKAIFGGILTPGTVVMMITLFDRIYMPLWFVCHIIFDRLLRQFFRIERVYELFDEESQIVEINNPVPLTDVKGKIEFNNVNFCYSKKLIETKLKELKTEMEFKKEQNLDIDQEMLFKMKRLQDELYKGVLRHFFLEVKPGELIAIVGPTGAGKSTIIKLLQRYYNIQKGEILIDGVDINKLALTDLRKIMAEVTQDTELFDDTIAINIACGAEVDSEMVEWAARQACIDKFIEGLPLGYDSLVGDKGIKLSGGQKQRIVIARAFLKIKLYDCKIVLLDEPTASLDSETEEAIQRALARLIKGRTTIMIAHRLSTIKASNRIVHIEEGRVTESGSHQELIDKGAKYAHLWRIQTEGFAKAMEEEV